MNITPNSATNPSEPDQPATLMPVSAAVPKPSALSIAVQYHQPGRNLAMVEPVGRLFREPELAEHESAGDGHQRVHAGRAERHQHSPDAQVQRIEPRRHHQTD